MDNAFTQQNDQVVPTIRIEYNRKSTWIDDIFKLVKPKVEEIIKEINP